MSLAGSRPRTKDDDEDKRLADELFASTKERKEHQLVVEHIVRQLKPRSSQLTVPSTPSIRRLSRLQHLETVVNCTLDRPDAFDVLSSLQPTPAVAGLPTDSACDYIARREGLHRGLYTGCLGTVCGSDTRFIVLRGGIVNHEKARLFAGQALSKVLIQLASEPKQE